MTGHEDDTRLVRDWATVVRAVDAVQQAAAFRLEKLNISLPYFAVLTLLIESPDQRLPMSMIARELSMTSGGFTKLADRMARDGLINRRGSSGDRRVVYAALTEVGSQQAEHAVEVYRSFLRDEVLRVVPASDLAMVSRIAARLAQLHREPDPDPFELESRPEDEPDRRTDDVDVDAAADVGDADANDADTNDADDVDGAS